MVPKKLFWGALVALLSSLALVVGGFVPAQATDFSATTAAYVPPVSFTQSMIKPSQTVSVQLNGGTADWRPSVTSCIAVGYTDATHTVNNFVFKGYIYWNFGSGNNFLTGTVGFTGSKSLAPAFSNAYVGANKNVHALQMTYDTINPIVSGTTRAHTGYKLVVAYYPGYTCDSGTRSTPTLATLDIYDPNATIAAPTNFRADPITKTGVTLKWDAVTGATEYYLYQDGNRLSWGNVNIVTGTSREIYIQNAVPGSQHTFGIEATNGITTSAKKTITINLQPRDPIPAPVSAVIGSNITYNEGTVSWSPVPGASWYDTTISPTVSTYDFTTTSMRYTGLTAETDYTVSVKSCTDGGCAPAFDYTFTTSVHPDNLPAAVITYSITNVTKSSAQLSWTAPARATSYNLYVNGVLVEKNYSAGLSYTFNGLTPNSQVQLGIEGVSSKGVGPKSSLLQFTTFPDPRAGLVPNAINTASCTGTIDYKTYGINSKHCSWSPAESASGYKIYKDNVLIATIHELFYELVAWDAGTYNVKIVPYNSIGDGPSSTVQVTMQAPDVKYFSIKNIVVTGTTDTTATFTWDAVPGATSYDIHSDTSFFPVAQVTTNTATVTGLLPGRDYSFTISAKNAVSNTETLSPWPTMPLAHTTGTFVAKPAPTAPTGVYSEGTTETDTVLWWDWDMSGNTLGYYVTVGSGTPVYKESSRIYLTGLTKATTYTVTIRPVGETPTTVKTTYTFTTSGGTGTVTGQVLSTGGTKLTWSATTGATGYEVWVANKKVATLANVLTYTITTPFGPKDDLAAVRAIKANGSTSQVGTYSFVGPDVTLGTMAFTTNSEVLSTANKTYLDGIAKSAADHGFEKVAVNVNVKPTSSLTSAAALTRATNRANAIKTYLATKLPMYFQVTTSPTNTTAADSNTLVGSLQSQNPFPF